MFMINTLFVGRNSWQIVETPGAGDPFENMGVVASQICGQLCIVNGVDLVLPLGPFPFKYWRILSTTTIVGVNHFINLVHFSEFQ